MATVEATFRTAMQNYQISTSEQARISAIETHARTLSYDALPAETIRRKLAYFPQAAHSQAIEGLELTAYEKALGEMMIALGVPPDLYSQTRTRTSRPGAATRDLTPLNSK